MDKKIFNYFRKKILGRLYVDFGDYRQTVFLAGTGRSGTTWIQNSINYLNNYRIMFEPFYSGRIGILTDWNYKQYLRFNNREEKFLRPATKILNGNIRDEWIDQFNHKKIVRKRLIKDIRANLFLKWIKHNFPDIPIILLLRHPCAVANSRLKREWDTQINAFLVQKELMLDYLNPFKTEIEAAKDIFDKHIFMWCIENYVPLRQFREREIHIVFYETLCVEPEQTIKQVLYFIGETFSPKVLDIIPKASAMSRKDSAIVSGKSLIDAWRNHITDEQIARAIEILNLFGLQKIYGEGSLPLLSGDESLRLFAVTDYH